MNIVFPTLSWSYHEDNVRMCKMCLAVCWMNRRYWTSIYSFLCSQSVLILTHPYITLPDKPSWNGICMLQLVVKKQMRVLKKRKKEIDESLNWLLYGGQILPLVFQECQRLPILLLCFLIQWYFFLFLLPTNIPCPFVVYLNPSLVYLGSFSLLIIFHSSVPD